MTEQEHIEKLQEQVEELTDKLIDLQFELNYNKQDELLEFVRDLYGSLKDVDEKLSKEEIIENLKKYIQNFTEDNKINL